MIKFSVIIPNYNHAEFLKERIDSVLSQTHSPAEVIILDDCSTDNSREIIETYRNNPAISHILYNPKNSESPFRQWKKGIQLAVGDWIWVAESDDIAKNLFLDKMTELITENPDISFAYCDAYIKNEMTGENPMNTFSDIKNKKYQTDKWKHSHISPGDQELNDSLKWECTVNNVSSVLFNKTKLLETIDNIQQYRYHGDWLLYILLCQKGSIAYTPEILNTYRDHKGNHSKSDDYLHNSKKECFSILSIMLNQEAITQKKELIKYFTDNYIGFGLASEKAFAKKGLFREYCKVNKGLTFNVLSTLLKKRMKAS